MPPLPATPLTWETEAREAGVHEESLQSCQSIESASKVTRKQFLQYRVLCPASIPPPQLDVSQLGLGAEHATAQQLLSANADFLQFLRTLDGYPAAQMGQFTGVFQQIKEVLDGQDQHRVKLRGIDETSVNSALISLLQALQVMGAAMHCHWRSTRIKLEACFGGGNDPEERRKMELVAITDGQLQKITNDEIVCLIECKRYGRQYHSPQVEMQEASQIVAWIHEFPNTDQRITISQDGTECYITIPEFDNRWERYIRAGRRGRAGWMVLRRYGPWSLRSAFDMRDFAQIVLAVVLWF